MVKRFSGQKKEKIKKNYSSEKNSLKITEEQIGKKYVSVFKTAEDGKLIFDAQVGDNVIVLRYEYGTPGHWNPGVIEGIEVDGTIKFWDQVLEQRWFFNTNAENLPAVLRKNV